MSGGFGSGRQGLVSRSYFSPFGWKALIMLWKKLATIPVPLTLTSTLLGAGKVVRFNIIGQYWEVKLLPILA